ncbi:MAG: radical SAM protein [Deltaproteobacteria bacterium]|nr:radical SAM protein [Deltaproteobacteria bacterium]
MDQPYKEPDFALTSLYLYLTDYCNLCCSHCWISPKFSQKQQNGIPLAYLKEAISEARSLGLQSVKLTGGEPFLYRDIADLLAFLASEQITVLIETNGTLINRDMVERLKFCNLDQLSVSLDAATEGVHDEIRGVKGTFHRTLEGLGLLSKHGLNFQIIMTLQRKNQEEIPGVIQLSEKLGASSLKINPLIPWGRGKEEIEHRQSLELEELLHLYRMVEKRWSLKKDLEIIFDLPVAFRSIENIKSKGINECQILNILGILGNGDLSICGIGQTVHELRMGNLRHDSICEIWQNSPILKDLRKSLPGMLKGICEHCIFKFQCLGACRAIAYALTGDLYAPYFLCQKFFESGLFPSSRHIQ